MALAIRQERGEPHVNADSRMLACAWGMFSVWLRLTDNEGIPVSISPMHEVNGLGSALERTMQLDLEEVSQLLRNDEVLFILMQIDIFAILTQLDGVPAIRFLEAWETHIRNTEFFLDLSSTECTPCSCGISSP